ncbi:MAG: hypothetical protein AAF677_14365 [Pseudomonadota bacterium]
MSSAPAGPPEPAADSLKLRFLPYVEAAVATLGIDTGRNLPGWFIDRWIEAAKRRSHQVPTNDDTIRRILNGSYPVTRHSLLTLHDALGLGDYGLDPAELWRDDGTGTALALDLDAFAARLEAAGAEHRDPLHLLRRHAAEGAELTLRVGRYSPGPSMAVEGVEPPLPDAGPEARMPAGSPLTIFLTTRVAGPVLLLSHRGADGTTYVLNENLGAPRARRYPANEPLTFGPRPAASSPGERLVLALNLPATLMWTEVGLGALAERKTPEIAEPELRRLGGLVAERAEAAGADRPRVATQVLRLT